MLNHRYNTIFKIKRMFLVKMNEVFAGLQKKQYFCMF